MLEVSNLEAGYGPIQVLHGVSLQVGAGEVVALIGANGAGKTTALLTISGLLRARAGSILFDGREIAGLPPHVIARRGLVQVPEGRQLFAGMTVLENLRMGAYARRGDAEARRLREVFDLFPMLGEHRAQTVGSLSGGQQQMVAIARALLLQPDLLIMDEPSTGLAPKVVKDILLVIKALRDRGMGLLLIEQNVGIASEITDRAYVMAVGNIVHEIGRGEWQAFLQDERLVKAYLG
jgi:ABC-type branched-subunit amino acid transport system ATPase component